MVFNPMGSSRAKARYKNGAGCYSGSPGMKLTITVWMAWKKKLSCKRDQKRSKEEIKKKWEVHGLSGITFYFLPIFCIVLEKHPKVPEKFFVGFKKSMQQVKKSQTLKLYILEGMGKGIQVPVI